MQSKAELMLGGLLRASHLATMVDLPGLLAEHAAIVGFTQTMIYVPDLQQQFLHPLPGQFDASGRALDPIRIDTTVAGRAFRDLEIVSVRQVPDQLADEPADMLAPGLRRLWVPMLDGAERIGVLGVTVPVDNETSRWRAQRLGTLIALLIMTKRDRSDDYAWLVRTQEMALSAEVLWNLMPAATFASDRLVLSASLEPAYDVGGDAFDYGVRGDKVHLSIFDAMGHDTAAGLTASIAVGAYRNSRLSGAGLVETSETIDRAIDDQFDGGRFATGILATLDTQTGWLAWVNRGHHPPLVLRRGRQVATLDETPPAPPMGLKLGRPTGLARYHLEPGDRLLFYTDGIIEARSPEGEPFGIERFTRFVIRLEADGISAPETVRRLIQSVLGHQQGVLQDDATVLLVEWRTQRHRKFAM
ncbi:PP2C family protein-serine/threonine phosphatase [Sphaerimonospora sp. CA-214678]|uniref:PP2C family protein-serine/threonine phosphatase n=1 Tax=Sphaerimonospora sp. CA-214678 TaxID=3240029 RepID=UPI003D93BA8C